MVTHADHRRTKVAIPAMVAPVIPAVFARLATFVAPILTRFAAVVPTLAAAFAARFAPVLTATLATV